jgi:hypothetical protein
VTDVDTRWIDLVDPTEDDLRAHLPEHIHATALAALLAPHVHDDEPRPRIESHDDYILGIFLLPVVVNDEDRVYYQEIDMIATTTGSSRSRRPAWRAADDPSPRGPAGPRGHRHVRLPPRRHDRRGYLDLVDSLDDEIDELGI